MLLLYVENLSRRFLLEQPERAAAVEIESLGTVVYLTATPFGDSPWSNRLALSKRNLRNSGAAA